MKLYEISFMKLIATIDSELRSLLIMLRELFYLLS